MELELLDKREEHIVAVALAFLKRCRLTSEALKVDMQLADPTMEYRAILAGEIDKLLERLGVSY